MAKGKKSVEQTLRGYLWLLGTLYSASKGLTLVQLSDLWQDSTELSGGEPLSRDTFIKRRRAIWETFGIAVICNRSNNRYHIKIDSDTGLGTARRHMVNAIAISSLMTSSPELEQKIQFHDFEKEQKYIIPLLEAIRDHAVIRISYEQRAGKYKDCLLRPYFLKCGWWTWSVVGYKQDEERTSVLIALNKIKKISRTGETFVDDGTNFKDVKNIDRLIY